MCLMPGSAMSLVGGRHYGFSSLLSFWDEKWQDARKAVEDAAMAISFQVNPGPCCDVPDCASESMVGSEEACNLAQVISACVSNIRGRSEPCYDAAL